MSHLLTSRADAARFAGADEATFSKTCYPRAGLVGCVLPLFRFERQFLQRISTTAFSLVPIHVLVIFVSILCSNHVDRRFGKGLMPREYRLR